MQKGPSLDVSFELFRRFHRTSASKPRPGHELLHPQDLSIVGSTMNTPINLDSAALTRDDHQ